MKTSSNLVSESLVVSTMMLLEIFVEMIEIVVVFLAVGVVEEFLLVSKFFFVVDIVESLCASTEL